MKRSVIPELLDEAGVPADLRARAYREIDWVQRRLGATRPLVNALRAETAARGAGSAPLRVLDIGCGQGALLDRLRETLGVDGIGFDLSAAPPGGTVPILSGNAVTDPLPEADVTICVMMAHHLCSRDLQQMIVNVSRGSKRFLLLDLVRHPLPLTLFGLFVAPLLGRISAQDGLTSIRRAYTAEELSGLLQTAANAQRRVRHFRHTVNPLRFWQFADIAWE